MLRNKHISLIIPCRNEQEALKTVLKAVPSCVDEVIVVDNLSTDNTPKVAKSYGASLILEKRSENGIGYGYAISAGINRAKGDIIVCLDGDGSYPVDNIKKIVRDLLDKNLDFISCNRSPIKLPKSRSKIRHLGVSILNFFIFLLYGYKIKDSLSGMWVFKKGIVNDLKLFEGGWNFSEEIKLSAISNSKIKFKEVSIPYKDREFNQSKLNIFSAGLNYLVFLFIFKIRAFNLYVNLNPKPSLINWNLYNNQA